MTGRADMALMAASNPTCGLYSRQNPAYGVVDDLIPAVLIENFVEQQAVNLHLPVFGRGSREEIIGVLYRNQPVLLAVHHQHRIGKFLHLISEPFESGYESIAQARREGFAVVGVFAVPLHHFRDGAHPAAQFVGQLHVRVERARDIADEPFVVAGHRATGDDAVQALVGILRAEQRYREAAHAVPHQNTGLSGFSAIAISTITFTSSSISLKSL